jgi:hypothetical protein
MVWVNSSKPITTFTVVLVGTPSAKMFRFWL